MEFAIESGNMLKPFCFLTRTLGRVSTEMSLQVLAYNLKRVISILGAARTLKAMKLAGS